MKPIIELIVPPKIYLHQDGGAVYHLNEYELTNFRASIKSYYSGQPVENTEYYVLNHKGAKVYLQTNGKFTERFKSPFDFHLENMAKLL